MTNFEILVVFSAESNKAIGEFSTLADAARCVVSTNYDTKIRTKSTGDVIAKSCRHRYKSKFNAVTFYTTVETITNLGRLARVYNIDLGDVDGMPVSTCNIVSTLRGLTDQQISNIARNPASIDYLIENGITWYDHNRDSWALYSVMRERRI